MNRFRLLRFERGLTLREVVDGSGVSERTLIRLEQGQEPSSATAKALADFYDVSIRVILGAEPAQDAAA